MCTREQRASREVTLEATVVTAETRVFIGRYYVLVVLGTAIRVQQLDRRSAEHRPADDNSSRV